MSKLSTYPAVIENLRNRVHAPPWGHGLVSGSGQRTESVRRVIPLAGLLGIVLVFAIAEGSRFMSFENWRNLVQEAAVAAIIGFGMTFVIVAGSIDLSVGAVAGLTGMIAAGVAQHHGVVVGVLAGLAVGAGCGLVNGLVLAVMRVPSFIATLGMLTVAEGITIVYSNSLPIPVGNAFGALGTPPGIYIVLLIVFGIAMLVYNATTFGRYTRAVGGDERVARLSGVPVRRMKVAIFTFCGLMAGLGGVVLTARLGAATPDAGQGFELTVIAAVVLGGTPLTGGVGNIWNTVIGALILTVLDNGLVILGISPQVQDIVTGVILVLAVFVALDRRKITVIK